MIRNVALASLLAFSLTIGAALAADPLVLRGDGVALDGYDAISFFTGSPKQGSASYEAAWKGGIFRFVSAANRDAFLKNPDKYAPQYGGYSPMAMAEGKTVAGSAAMAVVVDGKLFLAADANEMKMLEQMPAEMMDKAKIRYIKINEGIYQ